MEQKEQNLAAEQELTQAELSELLQIRRDKLKRCKRQARTLCPGSVRPGLL